MDPSSEPPDLFSEREAEQAGTTPLAYRMRPLTLDQFVGQEQLLAEGGSLRRAIEADRLHSMIFFGPPGTGKTSLARLIAHLTSAEFRQVSAVSSGVADLRRVFAEAEDTRRLQGRRLLLFVDEIHRFSKSQQDALLPVVESGLVTLIGATTENPYFEIIPPLLSRCELLQFEPLSRDELRRVLEHALADRERGLGGSGLQLGREEMETIVTAAGGDARAALSMLEAAVAMLPEGFQGKISASAVAEAAARKPIFYQKAGDAHYDAASAFIKSLRGSDADAALYWLATMLAGGEDPRFIARRMVIFASEDIGNADPRVLQVATSVAQAVEFVGLPECRINLAQGVTYLALAPKSNASYRAIEEALGDVRKQGSRRPPPHLRDAHYRGAAELGHGKGYKYPHDHEGARVEQEYFPPGMQPRRYYRPVDRGFEQRLRRRMDEEPGEDAD